MAMHLATLANRQTANRHTQTTLKGTETWARLPKDRWSEEWHGKYKDPVVRLHLAVYGHPDSGGLWEQHCEKMLGEVGFQLVFPAAWPSVFFHPALKLLLAVYVDDFKMSGSTASVKKGWELISSEIDMDSATLMGRYLGCEHHSQSSPLGRAGHPFAHSLTRPASVAHTEDYIEYFPEEDLVVHNHIQPRK